MQIRFGYELVYRCPQSTPMILTLHVHYTRVSDLVRPDQLRTNPSQCIVTVLAIGAAVSSRLLGVFA